MTIAQILGILTPTVGVPLLALASLVLWRTVRKYHNPVTRVQAIGVNVVLLHAFVFGLIFLNNDQPVPWLDLATTKIITRGIEFVEAVVVAVTVLWLFLPKGDPNG